MAQMMKINSDRYAQQKGNLVLKLELESDGTKAEVVSSHIDSFELEYFVYGFHGSVNFTGFDNKELDEVFNSEKPINVSFSYQTEARIVQDKKDPVEICGIAFQRSSRAIGIETEKQQTTLYSIQFRDALKESWSSHYPYKVYIEKTLKQVVDDEKNALIDLDYDFEAFNEEHSILALGLDYKKDMPHEEQPNFYDFLTWVLQLEAGVLEYDYKDNKYKIAGKKTDDSNPIDVAEWWVTAPLGFYPYPSRNSDRIIKHRPDEVDTEDKKSESAFEEVVSDILDAETYTQFPEQNDLAFKGMQREEKPKIDFSIQDLDDTFHFEHYFPGRFVSFKGDEKEGATWSESNLFKGKTYRIRRSYIKGEKQKLSEALKNDAEPFAFQIDLVAEDKEETYIDRPKYHKPHYPFSILGTVFSEIGDKEQTTYNVVKDEKAPLGRYEVIVPIGGEEKKVVVPFSPDFMTGQHYFPLCKDQQVMLEMYFRTAKIKRIVNWQPLTELPEKVQGCQIVYGSNGKDKYFYQKHEYVDGKDPVMTIKQSSSPDQTQVIEIKEKVMTFTVEEKGKRLVVVQFDREKGLFLQVDDKGGGITNQTAYTEKEITHTSKGSDGTSTVVQKPDAIEIECKKFTVKCEESTLEAKKTITNKAGSKVVNDAPVVQSTDKATIG